MNHFNRVPLCQLLTLWRIGATAPFGAARNALYWAVVDAIRASGFVGDARRIVERAARW